jgi:hypothetical protein
MNDYIPLSSAHLLAVIFQLSLELLGIRQIKTGKADSFVLQIAFAAASTHSCPHFVSSAQTLFHDVTSDESAGSCH